MKEKLLAAAAVAVAFGSGFCSLSVRQQEQGNPLDTDPTTQIVVPRINAAKDYLVRCNDPDLALAAQGFENINRDSKIAYVTSAEIGTKVIGVLTVSDLNGNPEQQIGINIPEITSGETTDQQIAADMYQAVKQYQGQTTELPKDIPQDC